MSFKRRRVSFGYQTFQPNRIVGETSPDDFSRLIVNAVALKYECAARDLLVGEDKQRYMLELIKKTVPVLNTVTPGLFSIAKVLFVVRRAILERLEIDPNWIPHGIGECQCPIDRKLHMPSM